MEMISSVQKLQSDVDSKHVSLRESMERVAGKMNEFSSKVDAQSAQAQLHLGKTGDELKKLEARTAEILQKIETCDQVSRNLRPQKLKNLSRAWKRIRNRRRQ